jgi:NADPH-dependent curcumin reductase CurA
MKAILEFNLPKDDVEYRACVHAGEMRLILWDFSQQIREWLKHGNSSKFEDVFDALEGVEKAFWELIDDRGIRKIIEE